jgi:hypothetical protein
VLKEKASNAKVMHFMEDYLVLIALKIIPVKIKAKNNLAHQLNSFI